MYTNSLPDLFLISAPRWKHLVHLISSALVAKTEIQTHNTIKINICSKKDMNKKLNKKKNKQNLCIFHKDTSNICI